MVLQGRSITSNRGLFTLEWKFLNENKTLAESSHIQGIENVFKQEGSTWSCIQNETAVNIVNWYLTLNFNNQTILTWTTIECYVSTLICNNFFINSTK